MGLSCCSSRKEEDWKTVTIVGEDENKSINNFLEKRIFKFKESKKVDKDRQLLPEDRPVIVYKITNPPNLDNLDYNVIFLYFLAFYNKFEFFLIFF